MHVLGKKASLFIGPIFIFTTDAASHHRFCVCAGNDLAMGASFSNANTTGAPFSNGNPATTCGCSPAGASSSSCINGCRSDFYVVTTLGPGTIQALACSDAALTTFDPRIYVWEGNSTDCTTFKCVGGAGACAARRSHRALSISRSLSNSRCRSF
jgi:hypothetical protein